jgi:MraZ protein
VLPGVQEPCLYVFPVRELARRIERIKTHSIADTRASQFARMVGSRSDLAAWDTQGRIRVKDELLDHAKLTSQVLLVGAFDRFELWNPEQWKASTTVDPASLNDAARYVGF